MYMERVREIRRRTIIRRRHRANPKWATVQRGYKFYRALTRKKTVVSTSTLGCRREPARVHAGREPCERHAAVITKTTLGRRSRRNSCAEGASPGMSLARKYEAYALTEVRRTSVFGVTAELGVSAFGSRPTAKQLKQFRERSLEEFPVFDRCT